MGPRFPHNPTSRPRPPAVAPWLLLTFFGFYALGNGGHISTPDGVVMMRVTAGIVDRGAFHIEQLANWRGFGGREVLDKRTGRKRFYAKYGIGLSAAAVPAYAVGRLLVPLARDAEKGIFETGYERARRREPHTPERELRLRDPANYRLLWYRASPDNFQEAFLAFCVSLTNSLIVAATVAGVYLICGRLGYRRRTAFLVALLAGVGTPLWAYSKTFFSEPLAGLGLIYCFYFALRGSGPQARWWEWALAGLMFDVVILSKLFHLVLLPAVAVLLLGYSGRLGKRQAAGRLAAFAAAVGGGLAVVVVYNVVRFGHPLATGYGGELRHWTAPALEGLAGLLVSPGRGLLIYCPLVLVSAMAARRFGQKFRLELLFISLCLLWLTAAYSRWYMWHGGWCWGPRFLVPVIALLVIPAAELVERPPRHPLLQVVIGLLLGLSVVVALSGVLVNYNDYHNWLRHSFGDYYRLVCWVVRFAPVTAYWHFPKDYFLLPHALRQPGLVLSLFGGFLACMLTGGVMLVRAWLRGAKLAPEALPATPTDDAG